MDSIYSSLDLGWYYSENREEFQLARISEKDRATHFYVIGATGTGKTKFLEYLIKQDIEKGNGFGVIDPHGDLIEDIKGFLIRHYLPTAKEIMDRVILIDPTDSNFTVAFNPLERIPGTAIGRTCTRALTRASCPKAYSMLARMTTRLGSSPTSWWPGTP